MPREKKKDIQPGARLFRGLMVFITAAAALNLIFTVSWASLAEAVVLLFLVWGLRKGACGLRGALSIALLLSGGAGLAVLAIAAPAGTANVLSLVWLGAYSIGLVAAGILLWNKALRAYLKIAQPPEEKQRKIHFFHGGWRDL